MSHMLDTQSLEKKEPKQGGSVSRSMVDSPWGGRESHLIALKCKNP